MKVCFWGTRGSLPYSVRSENIEKKIKLALQAALKRGLTEKDDLDAFMKDELSFDVRGSYGCNTSCIEVRGGTEHVLCDAGSGLRDYGNYVFRSGLKGPQTFHILMSHIHWDHIHGFPFFGPAFVPGNTVHIYGVHEQLEWAFVEQQDPPRFPLRLKEMRANIEFHKLDLDKTHEIAGFAVKIHKQNHPQDSYGYRFTRGDKSVVYSTDSEHLEEAYQDAYPFVEFIRGADLVVFDAQYNLAEHFHSKATWGHSSNMLGIELGVRAHIKRLCLFHNEHSVDDHQLEKFLADSRRYLEIFDKTSAMKVDLAYDGLELDL